MSYKAIITLLSNTPRCSAWTEFAADLAIEHEARLIGVAARELTSSLSLGEMVAAESTWLTDLQKRIDAEADASIKTFTSYCVDRGLNSFDARIVTGSPEDAMKQESMYCDLIVLGQHMDSDQNISKSAGVIESLLLSTTTPLLVVPGKGSYCAVPKTVLVAWRKSRESALALREAIPLLQRAGKVEIATVERKNTADKSNKSVKNELVKYLKLHGVSAKYKSIASDEDAANVLLSHVSDMGAELLVMGGYGHARSQEWALGGVTKTVLQSMTLPVLMAH